MKRLLSSLLALGIISIPVAAINFPDYALKNGIGVRALSMGGAQTGLLNGDAGIFYNPAVLARMSNSYEYDVTDAKKETFSSADSHRAKFGPLGFGLWNYELPNGDKNSVFAVSFSRAGNRGVDWGVTYKAVTTTIGGVASSGWSTDLGVISSLSKNASIGIIAQDLVGERVKAPLSIRLGMSYLTNGNDLTMSSDIVYFRDRTTNQFEPHFGAEYRVAQGLTIRGGWFDSSLTGGVQIQIPWVMLNYGVVQGAVGKRETSHMIGVMLVPPSREN